jgi:ribosome maturation factor RimP
MVEEKEIKNLVEEKIQGTDCFIVEMKISPKTILIYLDKPEGITIEECAQVTRHIRNNYSNPDELENYNLEVSSPGMDQPLKVYPQYLRRVGKTVKVNTTDGAEITGVLKSVEPEGIIIEESITRKDKNKKITETFTKNLAFSDIKETRIVISFK